MLPDFTPLMGAELFENKGMLMAVITVTGIVIVFTILILLIFIFYAYGAIFSAVAASKEKKKAQKNAASEKAAAKSADAHIAQSSTDAAGIPADGEIPGEIVAVIAAAVMSLSDGKTYRVKKVTRIPASGRTQWAVAGLLENTRPF